MIGFAATLSAYGRTLNELLGDEIDKRLRIPVEIGDAATSPVELPNESANLFTGRTRKDDGRAFGNEPPRQVTRFGHGDHRHRSLQPARRHRLSFSDSANARSTSARASTASAIATSAAAATAVSTSSSPHDPAGAWVSANTSAM